MRRLLPLLLLLPVAPSGCSGCGGDPNAGGTDLAGADLTGADLAGADLAGADLTGAIPPDGAIPDGGVLIHDGSVVCFPRTCQGKTYQCGDCMDNDGDNLVDSEDPECFGACQNNESGLRGDIPGQQNAPCKMDCYFDQDTGSGNDTCEWDHRCDPHQVNGDPETGCTYDPNFRFPGNGTCMQRLTMQSMTCKTFCGPLTPNGCDCFGCCVIPPNQSMTEGVYLGSETNGVGTCTIKDAADPKKCRPCQIVTGCFNPCGQCELCLGKTELPPECFGAKPDAGSPDGGFVAPDGGVPGQCPGGETPCGLQGQAPCPNGFYCVTGCCQPIIG